MRMLDSLNGTSVKSMGHLLQMYRVEVGKVEASHGGSKGKGKGKGRGKSGSRGGGGGSGSGGGSNGSGGSSDGDDGTSFLKFIFRDSTRAPGSLCVVLETEGAIKSEPEFLRQHRIPSIASPNVMRAADALEAAAAVAVAEEEERN